jgi:hypothetical protein
LRAFPIRSKIDAQPKEGRDGDGRMQGNAAAADALWAWILHGLDPMRVEQTRAGNADESQSQ